MGVDIKTLAVGSVVRLISGSPKMTVVGFGPDAPKGLTPDQRRTVRVLVWCDGVGFVRAELNPDLLVFPRDRSEGGE